MMIKRTVCLCSSASAPAHHLRPSKSLYFRLLFKRPPPPELPKKLRGLWGHRGAHHLFCPPMKSSEDERQADKQEVQFTSMCSKQLVQTACFCECRTLLRSMYQRCLRCV